MTKTETQTEAIVDRLRKGPALNIQLKDIALRYGARIFDARRAGFVIQRERIMSSQSAVDGLHLYTLLKEPA